MFKLLNFMRVCLDHGGQTPTYFILHVKIRFH